MGNFTFCSTKSLLWSNLSTPKLLNKCQSLPTALTLPKFLPKHPLKLLLRHHPRPQARHQAKLHQWLLPHKPNLRSQLPELKERDSSVSLVEDSKRRTRMMIT